MLRKALAVAGKELSLVFKDRGAVAVLFLLPLVLASVFGSISQSMMGTMEGEETVSLPVVLVNQDGGAYGQQIAAILGDIDALQLTTAATRDGASEAVVNREALAAIVIPTDFSSRVDGYEQSRIEVMIDPTQEQYAGIITGVMNEVIVPVVLQGEIGHGIQAILDQSGLFAGVGADVRQAIAAQSLGVIMTQLEKQQSSPWVAVRAESLEGVEAAGPWNPFSYTIPSFTVMFAFFLVSLIAESMWAEKESGVFRRLLASPLPRAALIGGKMLAYMLVVCVQVALFFTVGNAVFGMSLGHSIAGLVLLTLALALTAAALGMLVAALTRSSRQAETLGNLLGFLLAAVGGCLAYPLFRLEGLIGTLSRLTPHAHAVMGYMDLFGTGTLVTVLPQIGILLGMGLVIFLVALWRLKFD